MSSRPLPASARHLALLGALRAFSESSDRAADLAGRGLGLHRTDLRALSTLVGRQARDLPTTATELGRHLHLTKAATTAVVDRLVASGHAVRHRSTRDRRNVLVEPTASALSDGAAAFRPMAQHISAALEEFDDAELAVALRVVEAATRGIAPLAGEPPATGGAGSEAPAATGVDPDVR